MAVSVGFAAALHEHHYRPRSDLLWSISAMLVGASFWEFKLLLALPTVLGYMLGRITLRAF